MRFRPCIDIHNGKVKQIVGGSLRDERDYADENFISELDAGHYAGIYKQDGLKGGHIIILNPAGSEYYKADLEQAEAALAAYPGGLQIGGGITSDNAVWFLDKGASHVIVTSFVFRDGRIDYVNLEEISKITGKERLVLDLSCRKKDREYYIVTDRWQKFTREKVSGELLDRLSGYCDEFLVHAVDVEGKESGIEQDLACLLGGWNKMPVTYAGGIGSFDDLRELRRAGRNHLDVTIGSALSLFGGPMEYERVIEECR